MSSREQSFQLIFRVLSLALVFSMPAGAQHVDAIVGGTLIDGTGGAPRNDITILVSGDRIERIGPREGTPVPSGAAVIRAEGKFILPGFIDAHLHYRDYYPELLITHGITSISDWGGTTVEWVLAQKEGINKGKIYGPRIYTCGLPIPDEMEKDKEAAVQRVRELAAAGVDTIDVSLTIEPDVMAAVIEEAHRLGLPVGGYPIHSREASEASIDVLKHTYILESGSTKDPEKAREIYRQTLLPRREINQHLFLLGPDHDDLVKLMVEKGVAWIPTTVKDFKVIHDRTEEFEKEGFFLLSNPELQYLPDFYMTQLTNSYETGINRQGVADRNSEAYRSYQEGFRNIQRFTKKLVDAGGRVLAGSGAHSFVLPGLALHQEMQLLVDAGLTPMQALQGASLWVAEYLRVQKDIGSVEVGKWADIVILDKNPLDDIRNTRTVETVIKGGQILPTGYHRHYSNPIPRNSDQIPPGGANPLPRLDAISPLVTTEGSSDLTLTVRGDRFVDGAIVFFEGVPLETTRVSRRELRAMIPERMLRSVGTYWIHVANPRPGRGDSEAASLIVKYK